MKEVRTKSSARMASAEYTTVRVDRPRNAFGGRHRIVALETAINETATPKTKLLMTPFQTS
jgi:hypothetical protein